MCTAAPYDRLQYVDTCPPKPRFSKVARSPRAMVHTQVRSPAFTVTPHQTQAIRPANVRAVLLLCVGVVQEFKTHTRQNLAQNAHGEQGALKEQARWVHLQTKLPSRFVELVLCYAAMYCVPSRLGPSDVMRAKGENTLTAGTAGGL